MDLMTTATNLKELSKKIAFLDILEKIKIVLDKDPDMYFYQSKCYDDGYADTIFAFENEEDEILIESRNGQYDDDIDETYEDVFHSINSFKMLFNNTFDFVYNVDLDGCKELIDRHIKEINESQDNLNIRESLIYNIYCNDSNA